MTFNIIDYLLVGLSLLVIEFLYFRLARKFSIYDVPNHRSSHNKITIRGGGVIFWVSLLLFYLNSNFSESLFFFLVTVLAFVSFYDDIKPLSNFLRICIHFITIALLLYSLGLVGNNAILFIACIFMGAGILNAFNFMDGINGMTGLYGIVVLVSLLIINNFLIEFENSDFIIYCLISLIIFGWFNFRKYALCFAGDVGSFTIAFVIVFFIFKLIAQEQNYIFLLLVIVYGVDVFQTLVMRFTKGEKIFEAHKKHLFQILVNEFGYSHLLISSIYGFIQLTINALIIFCIIENLNSFWFSISIIFMVNLFYFIFKNFILKTKTI